MSWRALFTRHLEQVSFFFCPRSAHSMPVRNFLQKNYADLALLNPKFRFLVRDTDGIKPYILAQYFAGTGDQLYYKYNLEGLSEEDIEELLKAIALAGEQRTKEHPNNIKQYIPWKDIAEAEEY